MGQYKCPTTQYRWIMTPTLLRNTMMIFSRRSKWWTNSRRPWQGSFRKKRSRWQEPGGKRTSKFCAMFALWGCMMKSSCLWRAVSTFSIKTACSSASSPRLARTSSLSPVPTTSAERSSKTPISKGCSMSRCVRNIKKILSSSMPIWMGTPSPGAPLPIASTCSSSKRKMMSGSDAPNARRTTVWIAGSIGTKIWHVRNTR